MRKAYTRPKLYAESFELLEHISACTGYAPGLTTLRSADRGCSYTWQNQKLFILGLRDCEDDGGAEDGAELTWEVDCYHNPNGQAGHPFGS